MEKYGVVLVVVFIIGIILGILLVRTEKRLSMLRKERDKFSDFYQLASHWLEVKNWGESTAIYFEEMNYKKIAIYGMGEFANRLIEDLEKSDVTVVYGIDRDVCNAPARMEEVYTLTDELPKVDAIVVTPFYAMEEIENVLKTKVDCPIISLEEVIWSV